MKRRLKDSDRDSIEGYMVTRLSKDLDIAVDNLKTFIYGIQIGQEYRNNNELFIAVHKISGMSLFKKKAKWRISIQSYFPWVYQNLLEEGVKLEDGELVCNFPVYIMKEDPETKYLTDFLDLSWISDEDFKELGRLFQIYTLEITKYKDVLKYRKEIRDRLSEIKTIEQLRLQEPEMYLIAVSSRSKHCVVIPPDFVDEADILKKEKRELDINKIHLNLTKKLGYEGNRT